MEPPSVTGEENAASALPWAATGPFMWQLLSRAHRPLHPESSGGPCAHATERGGGPGSRSLPVWADAAQDPPSQEMGVFPSGAGL